MFSFSGFQARHPLTVYLLDPHYGAQFRRQSADIRSSADLALGEENRCLCFYGSCKGLRVANTVTTSMYHRRDAGVR